MRSLSRFACAVSAASLVALGSTTARAQLPVPGYGPQPGYGQPPGYGQQPGYPQQPGYGAGYGTQTGGYATGYAPTYQPSGSSSSSSSKATNLEMASLYVTSAMWGVGTGIWLDAEIGFENPGALVIPPLLLGVAAPMGVFVADRARRFRTGVPAAISTGLVVGAGEALGVATLQMVTASDPWGFKELARAEVIGSTVGGVLGAVAGYTMRPSPKSSVLISSSVVWGSALGSLFGAGASEGDFSQANDTISVAGLVGFNVGLLGAGAASLAWVPSWQQLGYMWAGFGVGVVATTPVYLLYIGSDADPRFGLAVQGIGGVLGLGLGLLLAKPDRAGAVVEREPRPDERRGIARFAQVTGVGPMSTPGGMGAQVTGVLF